MATPPYIAIGTVTGWHEMTDAEVDAEYGGEPPPPPLDAPELLMPADGAEQVFTKPLLEWGAVVGALSYNVQVATDIGFTNIVRDENVAGLSYLVDPPLDQGTKHWWRVRASDEGV
jgi:hypothetical protein